MGNQDKKSQPQRVRIPWGLKKIECTFLSTRKNGKRIQVQIDGGGVVEIPAEKVEWVEGGPPQSL